MIVLDTNVIASLMRPDLPIVRWLDRQPAQSIWTTSINVYETRFGIEILAAGRRRKALAEAFDRLLEEALEARILSFDRTAADAAGAFAARQRRAGRSVEIRDMQIAGITLANNATLATRNVKHFESSGLKVTNPWTAG